MKKLMHINGKLLLPLSEGNRAVIASGGSCIYTSRVVEIIEETEALAHFETMNSIYKVALVPNPSEAALPISSAMCA